MSGFVEEIIFPLNGITTEVHSYTIVTMIE